MLIRKVDKLLQLIVLKNCGVRGYIVNVLRPEGLDYRPFVFDFLTAEREWLLRVLSFKLVAHFDKYIAVDKNNCKVTDL